jgi:uncharacterized protein YcnI
MKIRLAGAVAFAATAALTVASGAFAHPKLDPPVGLENQTQLYTLIVPTEKSSATTQVELTPPASGFKVWSVANQPGWKAAVQQTGSGESAAITRITWTGGNVPTGESALLQFTAQPSQAGPFTFTVKQTYADGSVVEWSGAESSDTPAPIVRAVSSLGGGGGTPVLTIVALVLGALALVVAVVGVAAGRGGRTLA